MFQDARAAANRMQIIAEQAVVDNQVNARRTHANAATHDENLQGASHSEREETVRVGKIASDRLWNINEDSAFAVLLAKVVSNEVNRALDERGE
jgi:hypothetical protein